MNLRVKDIVKARCCNINFHDHSAIYCERINFAFLPVDIVVNRFLNVSHSDQLSDTYRVVAILIRA